jgi:hypothetical protein
MVSWYLVERACWFIRSIERNPNRAVVSVAGRVISHTWNALMLREAAHSKVGPDYDDGLLTAGVTALPTSARIRIGTIHVSDDDIGPIYSSHILFKDLPRAHRTLLGFLWQPHLDFHFPELSGEARVESAFFCSKEPSSEINLHCVSRF